MVEKSDRGYATGVTISTNGMRCATGSCHAINRLQKQIVTSSTILSNNLVYLPALFVMNFYVIQGLHVNNLVSEVKFKLSIVMVVHC